MIRIEILIVITPQYGSDQSFKLIVSKKATRAYKIGRSLYDKKDVDILRSSIMNKSFNIKDGLLCLRNVF